jgi:neutral ceramidase
MRCGTALTALPVGTDLDLDGYDWRWSDLPPGNAGTHDGLQIRATVWQDQDRMLVLLTADLLMNSVPLVSSWRAAVAAALAIPVDAVIIALAHTHAGPCTVDPDLTKLVQPLLPHASDRGGPHGPFTQHVGAVLVETARRAAALTTPCQLAAASAPCALGYVRRVPVPGGVAHCWNPTESPELAARAMATPDPQVTALWMRRAGAAPTVLWSAGAHPVGLGRTNRQVSADWPGAARRILAERVGAASAFVLGPCGDIHPWVATQDDPAANDIVGAQAAATVIALGAMAPVAAETALHTAQATIAVGGQRVPLAAWRIGPAILASGPVELFAAAGAALRRSTSRPLLIATNANGWTGYWPDQASWDAGGYEVICARALGQHPGDTESLVAAWSELIRAVDQAG